jgi:hypothetical protein
MLARRTLVPVLRLVIVATLVVGPAASAGVVGPTIEGFGSEQRAVLDWALGQFSEAGLALPPVDIVRASTRTVCNGANGLYDGTGTRATIHICTAETDPFLETLFLHELAHAWDGHTLSEEERARFLELRGLSRWWDDGSARWHELGAEHAAAILVWGLIDRPLRVSLIPNHSCDELRAGYVALTGRPPVHTTRCNERRPL